MTFLSTAKTNCKALPWQVNNTYQTEQSVVRSDKGGGVRGHLLRVDACLSAAANRLFVWAGSSDGEKKCERECAWSRAGLREREGEN